VRVRPHRTPDATFRWTASVRASSDGSNHLGTASVRASPDGASPDDASPDGASPDDAASDGSSSNAPDAANAARSADAARSASGVLHRNAPRCPRQHGHG